MEPLCPRNSKNNILAGRCVCAELSTAQAQGAGAKLGLPRRNTRLSKSPSAGWSSEGRLELGQESARSVRSRRTAPSPARFAAAATGFGFVRPHAVEGAAGRRNPHPRRSGRRRRHRRYRVGAHRAASRTARTLARRGEIIRVLERATTLFRRHLFRARRPRLVRVDGTVFSHSIYVGDPGAKGASPQTKSSSRWSAFPSPEERGEGVITEILGPRGQPGVDTLSIIRAFGLPDEFPEDANEEARHQAADVQRKRPGRP